MSTELKTMGVVRSIMGEALVMRVNTYNVRKGDEFVLRSEAEAEITRLRAQVTKLERHNKALVERRQHDVADIKEYCDALIDAEKRIAALNPGEQDGR